MVVRRLTQGSDKDLDGCRPDSDQRRKVQKIRHQSSCAAAKALTLLLLSKPSRSVMAVDSKQCLWSRNKQGLFPHLPKRRVPSVASP